MNINLLFLTITIKKNKMTAEEAIYQQQFKERNEKSVDKMLEVIRYRNML